MSLFEVAMLVCFGASWPFSIGKSLRTRQVTGKSAAFLGIVAVGYACGILHKLLFARDWVVVLYGVNLLMVLTDLWLYLRFARAAHPSGPGDEHGDPVPFRRAGGLRG